MLYLGTGLPWGFEKVEAMEDEVAESWVVPEACTLPTAEQPLRVAEFDRLFADHLQGIEQLGAQEVRMSFLGPEGLGVQIEDLADRETGCCSFFDFRVSTVRLEEADGEAVRLEIRVPAARADVLAA